MSNQLSLRIRFLLAVLAASTVMLAIFSVIIFTSISKAQRGVLSDFNAVMDKERENQEKAFKNITKQSIDSTSTIVANLSGPLLGSYDYVGLENLVKAAKQAEGVAYLAFHGSDGKKITKEEEVEGVDEVLAKKIVFDGAPLGELFVGIDYSFINAKVMAIKERMANTTMAFQEASQVQNRSLLLQIFLFALVCLALLSFVIYFTTNKSVIGPIKNMLSDLQASATEVRTESKGVMTVSKELSTASNEQASAIEQISASMDELSGIVENNVKIAQETQGKFLQVKEESLKGNKSMGELVISMQEIIRSTDDIEKLVQVIGEIAQKTKVIDEIVFQTKLLSFNASVEAERAGEHGRGFAVVAQEVGNLAAMSGKSAMEISSIVKSSIDNARTITTNNKEKVRAGGEMVNMAAEALTKIASIANDVSARASEIVQASLEQSRGIKQVNVAITQFEKQVQGNSDLSFKAAQSSESLDQQSQSLEGIISNISQTFR
ncbi:MAG: hypothetical protein A2504_01165 [Bdellovibrionales bacterium RIFOXYD12_FULL_39_22]|nr:MAG: hypothetical protein A2385_02055 [Bdellovibrionales bacterium RIFOXYB1_FULL_39_21]OFZ42717.1 MAG: hypothetical protein A2485_10240 [Bdellovibrionales bacterium RIFOXYC12_FULL_39_17]OFZ47276.1 MAG: hypothetical protein A2404_14845 [Bdellovibrionales bacterium RIFOXYC1_FULL_39_130]OFZ75442.1 MAG: hypothetical protein A2560_04115 [Bdellovibrionales bacterium RIFOXYD1_FULL_39_84]OFZ93396.1 MAG: hypothetical protein A2504_01165 [Bdellovibrionales bacterium RIFOXYD12_FULL_39_22]HLE12367.1 me